MKRIVSFVRPSQAIFRAQLALVESYSDLREDRATEILAQREPQVAFWSSILHMRPDRTKWTLELLDAALRLAVMVEMRLKHELACRRPIDYSPQVQPMILTPGHGSLPSGHATEGHMVAYVLWRLLRSVEPAKDVLWLEQLMRQAARIAINRTVAGLHFPVDSSAGQVLGLTLGDYFINRCRGTGRYQPWRFNGLLFGANRDFDRRDLYNAATQTRRTTVYATPLAPQQAQVSSVLNWLWGKARQEWP